MPAARSTRGRAARAAAPFFFSWPIALAYVAVGLVVAIVGGTIIGRMGMESQVADFVRSVPVSGEAAIMTRGERLAYARDQVVEIVHRVWPYVLIGVGIGAAIHNWVPADVISAMLGQDNQVQGRLRVHELLMFGRYPYHQGQPTANDEQKVQDIIAEEER